MINRITIHNIQDRFFQMEEEEGLFSLQMADGTYYWDIVRRQVYLGLSNMHGGPFAVPVALPAPTLLTKVKDLVKSIINLVTRYYLIVRAPKYIFITFQRIRQGSSLVDNISDHLYKLVSEDAVAIELMNKAAISYWDIIFGRKTRVPPVFVRRTYQQKDLPQVVEKISAVIHRYFGVSIDVYNLVLDPIITFRENKNYYLKLFAQYRPNTIIFCNNGTLNGLISAAKEMQVPTIELQHGGSSSKTIFWSYPNSILSSHPGLLLPTAYLTYSDFWVENTHYPVSWTHSIGSDYFYQESIAGDDDGVLIVSAYMYHETLLRLALELSTLDKKKKIYYKLHPHQFNQKSEVLSSFNGKSNIIVVCDEMDFPVLFKRCNYVVGIHSTTMYMALQAGKKVCLYKRYNYFFHDNIFEYVALFDNISELCDILDSPPKKYFNRLNRVPMFFQPFDAQRFLKVLKNINSYI